MITQVLDERFAEPVPSSLTRQSSGPIWTGYKNLLRFFLIFLVEKESFIFEMGFVYERMLLYTYILMRSGHFLKSSSHFMVLGIELDVTLSFNLL